MHFFVKCSIFSNGGGHVWWWLKLSTIILKDNHKCIIFLKSESNWPFSGFFRFFFIEIFVKFSFLNNGGGHVWWQFRSSTIILKGDHKCIISTNDSHVSWSADTSETTFKLDTLRMIVAKLGSNWFSGFREEDFWKSLQSDDDWQMSDASDGNKIRY